MGGGADASVTLASNQRLIWLGQQLAPGTPLFEVPYRYRIEGAVDEAAFVRAFHTLVQEADVLRTVAADREWRAPRRVAEPPRPCAVEDLGGVGDPEKEASDRIRTLMQRPLDPTEALYSATLFRLSDQDYHWFLKIHHSLSDALGGRALLGRLSELYVAECGGAPPPPAPDYGAFIERDEAAVNAAPRRDAWWEERSEAPTGTAFFRAEAVDGGYRHQRLCLTLSAEESRRVSDWATRPPFRQLLPAMGQFNLFATALVAWLSRLQGSGPVRLGVTTHGRSTPASRRTPGLFMQLLPFRVPVETEDSVADLSARVAAETLGFLQNAQPGSMTPATSRSFDVVLNFIDLSVEDFAGLPTRMEWLHNGYGEAGRKLALSVHRRPDDRWTLIFDFNESAFEPWERQATLGHLRRLVTRLGRDPDARIVELDFLAPEERAFLERHGGSARDGGREVDVWRCFIATAEACPDRTALEGPNGRWTYAQLAGEARQIGKALLEAPCADVVPVLCRREEWAVLGMLGVLAAGRCFLPVDADLPESRRRLMLEDAKATRLIDARQRPVVRPVADPPEAGEESLAQGACYVLYTSGSTGRPNGVVIGHAALLNLLEGFEALAPLGSGPCGWWTNVGFDVAIYEVFSAVLYGRTLCVPEEAVRMDPERFFTWLEERSIAGAYLPPFFLAAFEAHLARAPHSRLERLLVGVEPIPQRVLASIAAAVPTLRLINGYGPTETTVCATLQCIDPDDRSEGPAAIGHPVAGNTVRVVDDRGATLPPGVPGELLVGGAGVARGYLGRRTLTAERFLEGPGGPVYRTGDRVQFRRDGALRFLGRVDDQVKIRGHRVEPAGVAAVLRTHPAIDECVVLPSGAAPVELWAFYTAHAPVPRDELRDHLLRSLPRAACPARLFDVERLPRNRNGKIDHERLLALAATAPAQQPRDTTKPVTDAERVLADVWAEVLGLDRVGTHQNVLELGADSLSAVTVSTRARDRGWWLTPGQVFQRQTIAEQAASARPVDEEETRDDAPETDDRREPFPLTPVQQGMLLRSLDPRTSDVYLVQLSFRIRGRVDATSIRDAWNRVYRNQPMLRMACTWVGVEAPEQVAHPDAEPAWREEDWRDLAPGARAERLRRYLAEDRRQGFSLDRAPLGRVLAAREREDGWCVVWTFHHLLLDGLSTLLVLRAFAATLGGEPSAATPAPGRLPFRRFVEWRAALDRDAARRFWTDALSGRGEPARLRLLGSGRPDGPDRQDRVLDPALVASLRALGRRRRLTLSSLVHAAWGLLLARYTGQDDVVFGSVVAGRPAALPGAEQGIGCFINTLPVRLRCPPDATVGQWLTDVQERLTAFREHEHTALEDIQRWVADDGGLFDSIVVFESHAEGFSAGVTAGSLHLEALELHDRSEYPLALLAYPGADDLRLRAVYDPRRHDGAAIRRLLGHLSKLLQGFLGEEDPLSALSLLTAEESRTLAQWSHPPAIAEPPEPVMARIEARLEAAGEADAVVFGNQALSDAQLEARTAALARALTGHGLRAGEPVGLHLERSAEAIVALLGILRAGGAYVPIAPGSPASRRDRILEQAGCRLLITQPTDTAADSAFIIETVGRKEAPVGRPPGSAPAPTDTAYVIFTSGSTGAPKGVAITHDNLAHSTRARADWYGAAPRRFLLLSSLAVDSSVAGIFWTLGGGGCLVVPSEEEVLDPARLAARVEADGVTELLCVPSLYDRLLGEGAERLQGLRRVIVAGEACPAALVKRHFRLLPDVRLFNEYGPTEATVWATVHEFTAQDVTEPVPIGRPVPGVQMELLDAMGQAVPVGVPGEAWIGGPLVSPGYRNDPALTAERFDEGPDSTGRPVRRYRTGDRMAWTPDGTLVFLGRTDDQIKLRGFRVEPGEIEAALLALPGVTAAAVVGNAGGSRGAVTDEAPATELVAFVTASETVEDWRARLARDLSAHLVPARLVVLPALPRLPNGKVDRRALQALAAEAGESLHSQIRQALNDREHALVSLWRGLLRREDVGLTDNFFELGGHSLLVAEMAAAVRQDLGVTVSPAEIFQNPTIRDLLRLTEGRDRQEGTGYRHLFPIQPSGAGRPLVFCIPHFFTDVVAARFRGERPVYGMRGVGLRPEGNYRRWKRMEDLGAELADEIRRRFGDQDCTLAGYSFGASMAFEAARELERRGTPAAHLTLITPMPLDFVTFAGLPWQLHALRAPIESLSRSQTLRHVLAGYNPLSRAGYRRAWRQLAVTPWRHLVCTWGRLRRSTGRPLTPAMLHADVRVERLRLQARYRPGAIHTPTTLFNAVEPATDAAATWRSRFLGPLDIRSIPDPHGDDAAVREAKKALREHLETLEPDAGETPGPAEHS